MLYPEEKLPLANASWRKVCRRNLPRAALGSLLGLACLVLAAKSLRHRGTPSSVALVLANVPQGCSSLRALPAPNDTACADMGLHTYTGHKIFLKEGQHPRRKWALLLFNGEFDLLDIYLATLYHVVDGIVIAEAAETYTRLPKPVFHKSAAFQDRYSQFLPKMTTLTVHLPAGDPWVRERMSRHALLTKGLEQAGATEGDLVVIGDVDELPKPSVISALSRCNGWQHLLSGDRTVCLTSAFSYYSYEWSRGSPWFFPEVYLFYPGHPPTARKGSSGETCIASAGWHCSWCLPTVQDMQAKQLAYAHTEHALVRFTSEEHIVRQVLHGQDLAQRACCHSTRVPTAEMQVPDIVQDNPLCYPYLLDRRHGIVPGFVAANWTIT